MREWLTLRSHVDLSRFLPSSITLKLCSALCTYYSSFHVITIAFNEEKYPLSFSMKRISCIHFLHTKIGKIKFCSIELVREVFFLKCRFQAVLKQVFYTSIKASKPIYCLYVLCKKNFFCESYRCGILEYSHTIRHENFHLREFLWFSPTFRMSLTEHTSTAKSGI